MPVKRAKVAVVMGGGSTEREVSIASGTSIMRALESLGYPARSLDFDARFIENVRELSPDVVFNALHGPGGEDGTIQGILDWLGIPYTGSGILGCALAMDKHVTKKILAAEGLPTPNWDAYDLSGGALPLLPGSLDLPLVVKPRYEGSSTNIALVKTHEQWTQAIVNASTRVAGAQILAEEYIAGREFTCAVLGDETLPVVEIIPSDDFYTYDAKYSPGGSRHLCPAPIDEDLAARIRMLGLAVHRLIGLRDYSRTDFIVSKEGRPYILEVNALPGMTDRSLIPDAALAAGISYEALVDRLVGFALARRHAGKIPQTNAG